MNQNNQLASRIFSKLGDGNVFFSPYSIYLALSMVMEGASEEIKAEAMKSFGFVPEDRLRIEKVQQAIWEVANSLWYDKNIEIFEDYKDTLKSEYDAEVMGRDFGSGSVVKEINDWVSQKTHEKIKSILDNLSPLEIAVIVNAIYFKAKWANQFSKKNTHPSKFFSINGEQTVPMMNVEKDFKFFVDEMNNIQAIELPYRGGNISLVVVMPTSSEPLGDGKAKIVSHCNMILNEFGGTTFSIDQSGVVSISSPDQVEALRRLEKNNLISIVEMKYKDYGGKVDKEASPLQAFLNTVNEPQINEWFRKLDNRPTRKVKLYIPKFKMEETLELTRIIKEIGMTTMFKDSSLINIGPDIAVSRILHKAYVDIDEEGTEAAAVTAVTLRCKGISDPSPDFRVNKPFVFFIRHQKTNTVMFMGKVVSL